MTTEAEPPLDATVYGRALADAVLASLPGWTREVFEAHSVPATTEQLSEFIRVLRGRVELPLVTLLTADVDAQRQSPLALLRALIEPLTDDLRSLGAIPPPRDPFDEEAFPNDIFALGPRAWSDFGEVVGDAGLRWGAAKAMIHRQRHATPKP